MGLYDMVRGPMKIVLHRSILSSEAFKLFDLFGVFVKLLLKRGVAMYKGFDLFPASPSERFNFQFEIFDVLPSSCTHCSLSPLS